jgi:hypothetical protein
MSNGTTTATTIATILGSLNPTQLLNLRRHMTNSQEMQALADISEMEANPALAPTMLAALAAVPNLPPAVQTWVAAGISDPANFKTDIAQAKAALAAAATNSGILGSLGL